MALMTKERAYRLSALELAFLGDTVCDLMIRTELMFCGLPAKEMHEKATGVVNARAQAVQLDSILHLLERDETNVVARARNAHPGHSIPPAATREQYAKATGFEALMGYLYLTGQMGRAQKLFELSRIKEKDHA